MGNITKSLWTNIKHAVHAIPGTTDLIGWANHTGTDLVTEINECTVAELVAAGSGGTPAVDIGLRRATITRTDAQIKAMPTAGPLVVAAGVGGKVITLVQAIAKANFAAGAYTNLGGNGAELAFYAADLGVSLNILNDTTQNAASFTAFFGTAVFDVWQISPRAFVTGVSDLMSGAVNGHIDPSDSGDNTPVGADLTLQCANAGAGNFTGGNAANSLVIEILYWIA